MTTNIHEPTPEFTRFLEWQVTSAVRRRQRFAEPARSGFVTYLGAAAVIAVSMLIGAGGVAAAGRIQVNQQKQLLLAQQQGDVQLAEMQIAVLQKTVDDAKRRAAVGVTGQETVTAAEEDLQTASLKLARVRLNVEEVAQSGQPVQDDVTSPLVAGRDFVTARLQLDQRSAQVVAEAADKRLKAARLRHEVGLLGDIELLQAQADLGRAAGEALTVQEKIALRARFLAGGMTPAEATRQRHLIAARNPLSVVQSEVNVAAKRYALLQTQVKVGAAAEVDVLKAQLDLLTKQQDLAQLQARIRALQDER
jgi:outer membrane protein TolC